MDGAAHFGGADGRAGRGARRRREDDRHALGLAFGWKRHGDAAIQELANSLAQSGANRSERGHAPLPERAFRLQRKHDPASIGRFTQGIDDCLRLARRHRRFDRWSLRAESSAEEVRVSGQWSCPCWRCSSPCAFPLRRARNRDPRSPSPVERMIARAPERNHPVAGPADRTAPPNCGEPLAGFDRADCRSAEADFADARSGVRALWRSKNFEYHFSKLLNL